MNIKALLIDDHLLFRAGLEGLLTRAGIDVVATVGNGDEGTHKAAELEPDIVLLDMWMPDMDGLSTLKQLLDVNRTLKVVFLTASTAGNDLLDALNAGASGYLLKDIEPTELVTAIHKIIGGEIIVAPEFSSVLAHFVRGETIQDDTKADTPFSVLTPREYEVLLLLVKGQSNKVIARNLGLSEGTIKVYVQAMLRKLNLKYRIDAALMAANYGIERLR